MGSISSREMLPAVTVADAIGNGALDVEAKGFQQASQPFFLSRRTGGPAVGRQPGHLQGINQLVREKPIEQMAQEESL